MRGSIIMYSVKQWGHFTGRIEFPFCFSSTHRFKHCWWTHRTVPLHLHGCTLINTELAIGNKLESDAHNKPIQLISLLYSCKSKSSKTALHWKQTGWLLLLISRPWRKRLEWICVQISVERNNKNTGPTTKSLSLVTVDECCWMNINSFYCLMFLCPSPIQQSQRNRLNN